MNNPKPCATPYESRTITWICFLLSLTAPTKFSWLPAEQATTHVWQLHTCSLNWRSCLLTQFTLLSFWSNTANPSTSTAPYLAVSQSGETADTIAAVTCAQQRAATVLSLTNVIGSTMTRISRVYIGTQAGPEIGVAATKTFTSQLSVLAQLALKLSKKRGKISQDEMDSLEENLRKMPEDVDTIVRTQEEKIKQIAKKYADF